MLAMQEIDSASSASQAFFPPTPVALVGENGAGGYAGRHDDDGSAAQSVAAESVRVRKPRPRVRALANLRRRQRALVGASRHRRHRVDVRGERRRRAARQLVRRAHRRHEGLERGRRPRRPNGRAGAAAQLVRDDARRHVDRSGLGPEPADLHQRGAHRQQPRPARTPGAFTSATRSRSPTPACAIGAIVTANLASHPKLPDYQIAQVVVIPWDPGHSAAYDLGVGVAKVQGPLTLRARRRSTSRSARTPGARRTAITPTASGRNDSRRRQDDGEPFPLLECNSARRRRPRLSIDTGAHQILRVQLGIGVRSIDYTLDQIDHVARDDAATERALERVDADLGIRAFTSPISSCATRAAASTGTGRPGIMPQRSCSRLAADGRQGRTSSRRRTDRCR